MPKESRKVKEKKINAYIHDGEKRKNIPLVGLVSTETDKLNGKTKFEHDPHIDPYLSWAGKKEGMSFDVQNVSLHIHERIDPSRVIQQFLKPKPEKEKQPSLFDLPENEPPLVKAVDFYHHEQDWSNRLIAGDSLLVMNSLLHKEGMAGKVQMIYMDPPYGIKYNSNFQPFVNKHEVKDGRDDDLPAEPEMIKAFRDTWQLGIHSYLNHLRDRFLLIRDLLSESGSIFVQISDENIHHIKELLDEVFGKDNFQTIITFKKTSITFSTEKLGSICDFILWYSKNNKKKKYNKLFVEKEMGGEGSSNYGFLECPDGSRRRLNPDERVTGSIPKNTRIFSTLDLMSSGATESCIFDFEYEGKIYKPVRGRSWKTTKVGMENLAKKRRLIALGNDRLYFISYFDEYPLSKLTNTWYDTRAEIDLHYIVQTATLPIQRCMLMSSDPGDIVFDITCGSGTTAYVAEQWGRRWITCDTSRVAITLAKQRLLTAKFDYYELAYPEQGLKSGFKYKTLPHATLGNVANNEMANEEILFDQPSSINKTIRVTGPFTVEAVPSLRAKPFDGNMPKLELYRTEIARSGETSNQTLWCDELKATGVRTIGGKIIYFSRVEPMVGTRFLHASAEVIEYDGTNKLAYISFGPDYGPLEQRQVESAITESRKLSEKPNFIVFAAFHFDPEASKDIDEIDFPGVTILKAQMSVDLLTADLRKRRSSNQSYWLIGQPEIELQKQKDGKYKVIVKGFDYYDPIKAEIVSKGTNNIAMWFLDTDYDDRCIVPDQIFFPMQDEKRDWSKLAKALNSEVDGDALEAFSGVESIPFSIGENKKIAVKIIDNRGIESFVIKEVE